MTALTAGPAGARALPVSGDPWAGSYDLYWTAGGPAVAKTEPARVIIRRAADADPVTVMPNEGADLERWNLAESEGGDDQSLLRRFTPREYRDLSWTALHTAGAIECLSGARMFICRTEPGAHVGIAEGEESGGGEILSTRTGMFGVALHTGAFELEKTAEAVVDEGGGSRARDPLAISMDEIEGERADEVGKCLGDAVNSNTMGACVSAELDRQDARLNEAYRAVMKQLDDTGRAQLRSEELAWIRERDAGCQEEMMGGTGDMYEWPNCLLNETVRRRLVLESMLRAHADR